MYSVPYPWTANGFYFLYVQQFGPDAWGPLVYDLNADTWTPIGGLGVPAGWGKLSPTTVTAAWWMGSPATTCAAYPRADVVVRSPTGFVGGTALDQAFVQGGTIPGACRSEHAAGPPGWYLYRTGTL
ncbi:MAG: hypothetical protein ACR2KK_16715 [Acidimicrobiales bacterium]